MKTESFLQSSQEDVELKKEEKLERARKLSTLRQAVGRFILAGVVFWGGIEKVSAQDRINHKDGILKKTEAVHDIKTKEGMVRQGEILNFLDLLPQNWTTEGNINFVFDLDSLNSPIQDYWKSKISNNTLAFFSPFGRIIGFNSRVVKQESKAIFFSALAHESCHANDFRFDPDINESEKSELEKAVLDRIKSEDRFKSRYSEKLISKEHDNAATEYWAEICGQYFIDPSQLAVDDFELVHEQVLKNDQEYDWKSQLEERQKIVIASTAKHIAKK